MSNLIEYFKEAKVLWRIRKFASEETYKVNKPYMVEIIDGNLMLNEGINFVWTKLCGGAGMAFDASHSYIGVGDDSTPASPTQTGLNPGVVGNLFYKGMDSGYPIFGANQKASWRATFGVGDANFHWQEFTVSNGNSNSAVNLNRKISDQSTKVVGQIWELMLEITLA